MSLVAVFVLLCGYVFVCVICLCLQSLVVRMRLRFYDCVCLLFVDWLCLCVCFVLFLSCVVVDRCVYIIICLICVVIDMYFEFVSLVCFVCPVFVYCVLVMFNGVWLYVCFMCLCF